MAYSGSAGKPNHPRGSPGQQLQGRVNNDIYSNDGIDSHNGDAGVFSEAGGNSRPNYGRQPPQGSDPRATAAPPVQPRSNFGSGSTPWNSGSPAQGNAVGYQNDGVGGNQRTSFVRSGQHPQGGGGSPHLRDMPYEGARPGIGSSVGHPQPQASPWIVPARVIVADMGWRPLTVDETRQLFRGLAQAEVDNLPPAGGLQGADGMDGPRRNESSSMPDPAAEAEVVEEAPEEEDVEYRTLEKVAGTLIDIEVGSMKARKLAEKCGISMEELDDFLIKYPGILSNEALEDGGGDRPLKSGDPVKLLPVLELCAAYNREGCEDRRCRKLHLCRDFALTHECPAEEKKKKKKKKGKKCHLSHNLAEKHNCRVLQKVLEVDDIQRFSKEFALHLVTFCIRVDDEGSEDDDNFKSSEGSNDSGSDDSMEGRREPVPLRRRARREDEEESASLRSSATATTSRRKRSITPRVHLIDWVTVSRSLDVETDMEDVAGAAGGARAKSKEKFPILCTDFARFTKCSQKTCPKIHGHPGKSYVWQVSLISSRPFWINVNERMSTALENGFSDPNILKLTLDPLGPSDRSTDLFDMMGQVAWEADFGTMTTASTVLRTKCLALRRVGCRPLVNGKGETKWNWYFKNQNDEWVAYGEKAEAVPGTMSKTNMTSEAIEAHFVKELSKLRGEDYPASPDAAAVNARPIQEIAPLKLTTDFHKYELDFGKMVQINTHVLTKREVRRRPAPQGRH